MIIRMLHVAGMGEGGEQNAPLPRGNRGLSAGDRFHALLRSII